MIISVLDRYFNIIPFFLVDHVANLDALVEHPQHIHVDFDEWLKLDEKMCKEYRKINRYWNKTYFSLLFNKQSKEATTFFNKNLINTGSFVEYSAICRTLVGENIELELDQLYCIGQIDKDSALKVLTSVQDRPGFFRVKTCVWEYLFPFYKKENTYLYLCPHSNDTREDFKAFSEIFNVQNEFVPTAELRKFCTKVTQEGIEDPDNVVISGPASTAYQAFNQATLTRVVTTFADLFPDMLPLKYDSVSLNEIIKTGEDSIPDASEDLESLYAKAFPRERESKINFLYLHHLMTKLSKNGKKVNMIQLFLLIKKMKYFPYAEIKELGCLYFDHVLCIHLRFWPSVALNWPDRKPRYWPDKKTVRQIVSEGCHIVPKSPRGENNNEWRTSFSTAELTLSSTLTKFQRRCYLVAKTIYYVVIKKIDPDVFASYFLKTLMFKLLEKQHSSFWEKSSLTDVDVTTILFKDLSSCFESKTLTSFFVDDLNLLERIENNKLILASGKAAAVANNPLAFLPKDYNEKIELIKRAVRFEKGFGDGLKTFYKYAPLKTIMKTYIKTCP